MEGEVTALHQTQIACLHIVDCMGSVKDCICMAGQGNCQSCYCPPLSLAVHAATALHKTCTVFSIPCQTAG